MKKLCPALLAVSIVLLFCRPAFAQDTDLDGMPDSHELLYSCLMGNTADAAVDYDADGLTNLEEYLLTPLLDPCEPDTDADLMPDGWEAEKGATCGLSPITADGAADADTDALTNVNEYIQLTDPCRADSDFGCENDGAEVAANRDPLAPADDFCPTDVMRDIGGFTGFWYPPLYAQFHDTRTQTIYLASEVNAGGTINSLALYVGNLPGQPLENFTIRLKHTPLATYSAFSWQTGFTTVYQGNTTFSAAGWHTFTFSPPFHYNGVDNLLIDYSFNNSSASTSGSVMYGMPGGNRTMNYFCNSTSGDPLTWSGSSPGSSLSAYVARFQLGMTIRGMADTDKDGMSNAYETYHAACLNPAVADAAADPDADGLNNLGEFLNALDPCDGDFDHDGLGDGFEVTGQTCGLDPRVAGGTLDDPDLDGIVNEDEFTAGTNPCLADTDGDASADPVDCNPTNPNAWVSCATCQDGDTDNWFVGCDAYTTVSGPDCNDANGNAWNTCATCNDDDGDSYYELCNAYGGINGPDCNDGDLLVNPGQTEILCDAVDNDCNAGTQDAPDADADGLTLCVETGLGTLDSRADTDFGCENDGAEVSRGQDPLDPLDDDCPTLFSTVQTGNYTTTLPFDTAYNDARTNILYLSSELGAARDITAFAINIITPPNPQLLHNFTIRMKPTTWTSYTGTIFDNAGWTTVYRRDTTVDTAGWRTFIFDTPFSYNGADNLLVDLSFDNDTAVTSGSAYASWTSPTYRGLWARTSGAYGDPRNWTNNPLPTRWYYFLNAKFYNQVLPDNDADGLSNAFEAFYSACLDSNTADQNADPDGDSLTNLQEYLAVTSPCAADTDADGMPDGFEVDNSCLNPRAPDPALDADSDGLTNLEEYAAATDACDADSDGDGSGDGVDCDPLDPNVWVSCGACVDVDADLAFTGCDDYTTVNGPDCNDANVNTWTTCATCQDGDGDSYFGLCNAYAGINGPDCNDANVNTWNTCATCQDGDGDSYFGLCNAYAGINGPDCNDANVNTWDTCATCIDSDTDGWFDACNTYSGINGPDCSDADPNVFTSCGACVDVDADLSFTGCDAYTTVNGPDCNDAEPNIWNTCATCVDGDGDTYFGLCNAYAGINGPDCNDANVNTWNTCATCQDGDGDSYFGLCNAYAGINGPDCNDGNVNTWDTCATCIDSDADGWFAACNTYSGINGPDCSDGNPNVWTACGACLDGDADNWFVGCDAYTTVSGPDCDDAEPNIWNTCATCNDDDGDTWFELCNAYAGINGPDCNDANVNAWNSCATCIDGDGDSYFGLCNAYAGINGPDCNDANVNTWDTCATCIDSDADGWFDACNTYAGINGPDCSDGNPNVWTACGACLDGDADNWFVGCDAYTTVSGPDCNDAEPNIWNTCATCNDDDGDTWFELCNAYAGINGPDCNDGSTAINPGHAEVWCDGLNNDCNAGTTDTPGDTDGDGLTYCQEMTYGTSPTLPDTDFGCQNDGAEVAASKNPLNPTDDNCSSNTTVTIGAGTLTWQYPLYTFYHDSRTQTIYRSSEIGGAATLTSLALDVTTIPGQIMNNFTIRLKHTALNSYASASWETGWTTVYQANEARGVTGWRTFTFTTPFVYNGTSNLIVDISINNSSYTSAGYVRYSSPGTNRSLYFYSDSLNGDPLTWSGASPAGTLTTLVPNIRLGKTTGGAGDTDGDGMSNAYEIYYSACLNVAVPDAGANPDADTLTNLVEYQNALNPCSPDTDSDGMPDGYETDALCLNARQADAAADPDADGLTNLVEYGQSTDPCSANSDGDGSPDSTDCAPLNPNSWNSCAACVDGDGDAWFVGCEAYVTVNGPDCNDATGNMWNTCATCIDDDADLYFELCNGYSGILGPDCNDGDPTINPGAVESYCDSIDNDCNAGTTDTPGDTDGDGLAYCQERSCGTSPTRADTDFGCQNDGAEVAAAKDPLDPRDDTCNIMFASVGAGAVAATLPLSTNSHDARTQLIYLSSELGGPRIITSIAFNVVTIPSVALNNFTIRMKSTLLSNYAAATFETAGWVTVYRANTTISATGWRTFVFTFPFSYGGGINNLMVDISFDNAAAGTAGAVYATSTSPNYRGVFATSNSANGDPRDWTGAAPVAGRWSSITNMRFYSDQAPDVEGDSLSDAFETYYSACTSSSWIDTNWDPDGDSLTNYSEYIHATNPCSPDTDADTMTDKFEVDHDCLNPRWDDSVLDGDSDGLNNLQEFQAGTDPCANDSDTDGSPDSVDCDPIDPNVWISCAQCLDTDADNWFDGCDAYVTIDGPDCDAVDPNVWDTCLTCGDNDADGWFDLCNAYVTINGPDCNDANVNAWDTCATCQDGDGDSYFGLCNAYAGIDGPDCDDVNPNAWDTCATCIDADADGWFGECNVYATVVGPDCSDADPHTWDTCATCQDGDNDGYYLACNDYTGINGPDCNDAEALINPGQGEIPCDGIDNDCSPATRDIDDQDHDHLNACDEQAIGTSDLDPDSDDDGVSDWTEFLLHSNPLDPAVTPSQFTQLGGKTRITSDPAISRTPSLAWSGSEFGVVWDDRRSGNGDPYFARISADGNKIGDDLRLTSNVVQEFHPQVAWSGGEFGVNWSGGSLIWFTRVSADGTQLAPETQAIANGGAGHPRLVSADGEYGMSWSDFRDSNSEIYFCRLDLNGGMIGSEVRLSFDPEESNSSTLAWTGSEYGVAWQDTRVSPYGIYFTRVSSDGVRLGGELDIGGASVSPGNPALAWNVSEFGAAWYDSRYLAGELTFARLTGSGEIMGEARITFDPGWSYSPAIASTGVGYGFAWSDKRGGNIYRTFFNRMDPTGNRLGSDLQLAPSLDGASSPIAPALVFTGSEFGVAFEEDTGGNAEIFFARLGYLDPDGDWLLLADEIAAGTDPDNWDTDGDRMPDGWEAWIGNCGTDPVVGDSTADPDADGWSNLTEYQEGTDPCLSDYDGDGALDSADCDNFDPDVWVSCGNYLDDDGDGFYTGCDQYTNHAGPDCDDADPNNWTACATCIDSDADDWFGECDIYDGINGPDCNDADPNNWTNCAACVDDDADLSFIGCDAYVTLTGPDCDDANVNAWDTCATCIDSDSDGWYELCDSYDGISGPDCDDANVNAWDTCASCKDDDWDGWYELCNAYGGIDGPDCNDSDPVINPGQTESPCNGIDEDCNPATIDDKDDDADGLGYCIEQTVGSDDTDSDSDDDGFGDLTEFNLGSNPIDPDVKPGMLGPMNSYESQPYYYGRSSDAFYGDSAFHAIFSDNRDIFYQLYVLIVDQEGSSWEYPYTNAYDSSYNPSTVVVGDQRATVWCVFTGYSYNMFFQFDESSVQITGNCSLPTLTWTGSEFGVAWLANNHEIYFTRISTAGEKIGSDLLIADTYYAVVQPGLVWTGSEFGITWTENHPGNGAGIFQRLDPEGMPIGGSVEFDLHDAAREASLAWTGSEFAVAWGDSTGPQNLFLRRIGAAGDLIGEPTAIASDSADQPDLIWNGSEFGLTWVEYWGGDTSTVKFTTLDPEGDQTTPSVQVNPYSNSATEPSLTWGNGRYGLAWTNWDTSNIVLTIIGYLDGDGDGISADDEMYLHGTNPNYWDTDGDLMADGFEIDGATCGLSPFYDDSTGDPDGDGLDNLQEYHLHSSPCLADTDGDGSTDDVDCDPVNPNVWASCATCWDEDGDLSFDGCDAYVTIAGPDCAPSDPQSWSDCGLCNDFDSDTYYQFCNNYYGNNGPDCDDGNPNAWDTCATCKDDDLDGWYGLCNNYDGINGPDCNDGSSLANPGLAEAICDGLDNDCDPITLDDWDDDQDALPYCIETDIGTDDNNPDFDGDGVTDGSEYYLGADPTRSYVTPGGFGVLGGEQRVSEEYSYNNFEPRITWTGSEYGIGWMSSVVIMVSRLNDQGLKIGEDAWLADQDHQPNNFQLAWTGSEYAFAENGYNPYDSYYFVGLSSILPGDTGGQVTVFNQGNEPRITSMAWTGSEFGILYRDYYLYFQRVSVDGDTIGARLELSSDSNPFGSLAWTGSNFGAVWADEYGDGVWYTRLSAVGEDLGPHIAVVGGDPQSGYRPVIVWNGSEFGISYTAQNYGSPEVHFSRIDPYGTVFSDAIVFISNYSIEDPASLVWTGENYGLAWQDYDSYSRIMFARIAPSGDTFEDPIVISADQYLGYYRPGLVFTGSEFGFTYLDDIDYNIWFSRLGYADPDGDGILADDELLIGTDPADWDTDGDFMADGWEADYTSCGLDPLVGDSLADPDGDGLINAAEFLLSSNPCSVDSDSDGVNDDVDCNPTDPNNWVSCATCQDEDTDLSFTGCDAYVSISGPDCAPQNPSSWDDCETCHDNDFDGWYEYCNTYDGISGPDCNDDDINVWVQCSTCNDDDLDGWYELCDGYYTVNGPDCDDGNSQINPGRTEVPCDSLDNDCNPNTLDDWDGDADLLNYCAEPGYGTSDLLPDTDFGCEWDGLEVLGSRNPLNPLDDACLPGSTTNIGVGATTWGYPLASYYHDARTQVIYLASEIGRPGVINSLSLNVTIIPGQVLNRFTIRLRHTPLANYNGHRMWESAGWVVVYQANVPRGVTGWRNFTFSQPFAYNGTDNLMVDFSFDNNYYSSDGLVATSSSTNPRSLYYRADSWAGDPLTWHDQDPDPGWATYYPNLRFHFAGTVLVDTDGDGMSDAFENYHSACLNRLVNDAAADPDADGLSNYDEYVHATKPCAADSDGDGMPDGWEVDSACGLNPRVNDALEDPDADGVNNIDELLGLTDPCVANDADGDGFNVIDDCDDNNEDRYPGAPEICDGVDNQCPGDPGYGVTDEGCAPADTDQDGLSDDDETNVYLTDPDAPDTDGDGMIDGAEVIADTDPLDASDFVRAVPRLLTYKARLLDGSGQPVVGPVPMVFSICAAAEGGTVLWSDTASVDVTGGQFEVMLGGRAPIAEELFVNQNLWLQVRAGGQTLSPRRLLTADAEAGNAGRVGGARIESGAGAANVAGNAATARVVFERLFAAPPRVAIGPSGLVAGGKLFVVSRVYDITPAGFSIAFESQDGSPATGQLDFSWFAHGQ